MANRQILVDLAGLSEGERIEMRKLGILGKNNEITGTVYPEIHEDRPPIMKHVVHAPQVLNEAYNYQKPSSFSRQGGTYWELQGTMLEDLSQYHDTAGSRRHVLARCCADYKLSQGY